MAPDYDLSNLQTDQVELWICLQTDAICDQIKLARPLPRASGIPTDRPLVAFVGTARATRKGVVPLVAAFDLVAATERDAVLVLGGQSGWASPRRNGPSPGRTTPSHRGTGYSPTPPSPRCCDTPPWWPTRPSRRASGYPPSRHWPAACAR